MLDNQNHKKKENIILDKKTKNQVTLEHDTEYDLIPHQGFDRNVQFDIKKKFKLKGRKH